MRRDSGICGGLGSPGGARGEGLSYSPLANLLDGSGGKLRARVFFVGRLKDQGPRCPDFGSNGSRHRTHGGSANAGERPDRGVVEVKPSRDDP